MSSITGNAGEIPVADVAAALRPVLMPQEQVYKAFQVGRDKFAFTDRRLILVDKQGITGSRTEYRTIPYKSITNFSVETAGNFDLDAEMKIYLGGNPLPIQREFNKKVNVREVQSVLAQMVLR